MTSLPDALSIDPSARVIMRRPDYNELMTATRGRVRLRRLYWRIEARRYDDGNVRVWLRRETR